MAVPTGRLLPGGGERIRLAVLGSTGSIGTQTLQVVDEHPDRFEVVTLAAGTNSALLQQQIARYRPKLVACDDAVASDVCGTTIVTGSEGLISAATHDHVDMVVVATSGHAAIIPTARAIEAGKTIALANKETIVCAGELIVALAAKHEVAIRPVDSEHGAIWQSLGRSDGRDVERLILTASGGPFRESSLEALQAVTVAQALAHPTWNMGGKITIDSATLMNKGLELIEAHWLFGVPYDRIDIVVHPESIIHSLVEFVDGSQVAQLSHPDMRLPIQYALTYPYHVPRNYKPLSLAELGALHFFAPDETRFPALRLAREAGTAGRSYPTVLSAADDVAVKAFMDGAIGFTGIAEAVEHVLAAHEPWTLDSFEAVTAADEWAHAAAWNAIDKLSQR